MYVLTVTYKIVKTYEHMRHISSTASSKDHALCNLPLEFLTIIIPLRSRKEIVSIVL